ncbi:reverse transcriptase [Artemisia annua]|uniref:RNA-directed DNA polymerase n=1 Tax=Artemisia annua TaxID=35608 RepID=A0A2U1N0J7_ARTAN|nr:reverse transcriptase [Artemisia annua]
MKKKHIEKALEEVCSENPLDKINTNNQLVSIKLKDPLAEINIPNRIPYSIKDVKEFKEECQQLLNKGIIRESSSPHSAPAFYVENNNEVKRGKRRMVINYKKMNDPTIGDSYKLPRKDYILEKLKGNTHFKLYNPETKDFLIVETDASDDTWAGCMKAIQNGKELLGLNIDGIPIPQSNLSKVLSIDGSQIPQSDSVLLNSSLQVSNNEQTSVLKTEKYKSKLCKYISGTFSETEQKYSTHEKETLACLKTLKKWKIDLLQTRFELRTDSKYKTQESESPSSRKSEFIKIEEYVEQIVQNSIIGKQKWYVILNGPFKGIYSDWALASPHIIRKSVSHKSYTSQEDAKQALKESYKTVTTEEVPKSRRFISLNQRLQETSPKINPIDLIRSIPTTRERGEMKKPNTIYTDGTTIREFQEFPIQVQNIIKTYNALFAHHRPLYFKLHSSYPVFDNNNHKLLVPSITLAELGVSNDIYPPKYEPTDDLPPVIPSPQNLVNALAGVFFASLKLGTGTRQKADIKIKYSKNNMLIYSNFSKGTIDEEQLKVLADFEEPFEKFTEPLSILPEDFKIALCQKLFHISRHVCKYCTASQMQQ